MIYDDIVKLISSGVIVYGINEDKNIIEGKVVSVVNYREALSCDVYSDTPDINLSERFNITLRLANGESEHVNEIYLIPDDAKSSLNIKIDGEIKALISVLTKAGIESKVVTVISSDVIKKV
jgi:hypothetical protein